MNPNYIFTRGQSGTFTYDPNTQQQWVNSPYPAKSGIDSTGYSAVKDESLLAELISQCGKSFYYLVSPYASGKEGKWLAKGTRAEGEGATAVEAVMNLLTLITPEN